MHVLRSQPYRPAALTPGNAALTWDLPNGGSASKTDMSFGRRSPWRGKSRPWTERAYSDEPLGAVEAQAPSQLVLVHDRVGVAGRDAGIVRQPVRALTAAQERRAGFKTVEPLSEVTPGNDRDACNETTVQIR